MKCISVPKNVDAQSRLNYDECLDDDLYEVYLSDEHFNTLDETGVFTLLNKELDINIDEYEDESIADAVMILKARLLVEGMLNSNHSVLLEMLLSQIKKAEESQTGVYFFF
ncbi:hypothetical protein [Siccibacter turicensis]|uniref:hypothetical protein n=1 Tax=Siccibacter turicensis TaxID=357233 RepID=UPI002A6B176C|nr:hypothetical protein [Siccibacter turicensis]MDY0972290.1 hypothetical protein [Siccibacter turicensis]